MLVLMFMLMLILYYKSSPVQSSPPKRNKFQIQNATRIFIKEKKETKVKKVKLTTP